MGPVQSQSEQPIRFAGSELGDKRHLCALFSSREQEYRLLLPFIKEGFERGEKAFHVVDPELRDDHTRRLEATGIDIAAQKGYPRTRVIAHLEWFQRDVNVLLQCEARFNLTPRTRDP